MLDQRLEQEKIQAEFNLISGIVFGFTYVNIYFEEVFSGVSACLLALVAALGCSDESASVDAAYSLVATRVRQSFSRGRDGRAVAMLRVLSRRSGRVLQASM